MYVPLLRATNVWGEIISRETAQWPLLIGYYSTASRRLYEWIELLDQSQRWSELVTKPEINVSRKKKKKQLTPNYIDIIC